MTALVGILNLTPDSFSTGNGEISYENALNHFENMVKEGAKVIDIGAESTRPGATPLTTDEEWRRLKPFLELLSAKKKLEGTLGAKISIDSYHPQTIAKAIELGLVDYVNDVNGFKDAAMIDVAKNSGAQIIFMHSLTIPVDKNICIRGDEDELEVLTRFATTKILELEKAGIPRDKMIFDVGLGFGKTPKQSYNIIKNIQHFKALGIKLYVGHSEKSFLSIFTNKPAGERGIETAMITGYLAASGVDYIRVHDIALNKRAIKMKDIFI
jgi:dihydropteroate synthase